MTDGNISAKTLTELVTIKANSKNEQIDRMKVLFARKYFTGARAGKVEQQSYRNFQSVKLRYLYCYQVVTYAH